MSFTLRRVVKNQIRRCLFILGSVFTFSVYADTNSIPSISIIIDDLGYRFQDDIRALALPGPVAYAILPHGPHTERVSRIANARGKEILLHQPMQALDKNEYLGPGGLTLNMTREEFVQTLTINMSNVPNLIGVNNHMGSLLTRHPGHMQWLMETLKLKGQIYIDSLTSDYSVAAEIAHENNLPYLKRDVFLDNEQNRKYIRQQFKELIRVAKRKGSALGIAHPHTATVDVLNEMLIDVDRYGVNFIGIKSLLVKRTNGKRYAQGPASSGTGL